MAYALVKTDDKTYNKIGVEIEGADTYLCDAETDITSLPTTGTVGSKAIVIESGETWMLGPSKIWKKFGGSSFIAD